MVDEDRDNFLFVMTAAPTGGVNWKDALLSGNVDVDVARRVGAMLGVIHRASAVDGANVPENLKELRIWIASCSCGLIRITGPRQPRIPTWPT